MYFCPTPDPPPSQTLESQPHYRSRTQFGLWIIIILSSCFSPVPPTLTSGRYLTILFLQSIPRFTNPVPFSLFLIPHVVLVPQVSLELLSVTHLGYDSCLIFPVRLGTPYGKMYEAPMLSRVPCTTKKPVHIGWMHSLILCSSLS